MHGDFSLNPLTYRDRVSRVLFQMGRVQLDSDANEQTEATLHFLRGLARDVIGCHGGPDGGFRIIAPDTTRTPKELFRLGWGEYYVDGIRCVNKPNVPFWDDVGSAQPILGADPTGRPITASNDYYQVGAIENPPAPVVPGLIYLAVWERHISSAEDDRIREVALNGPDTASRAVVVWQIRVTPWDEISKAAERLKVNLKLDPQSPNRPKLDPVYLALNLRLRGLARLKAFAKENQKMEACTISPEARYRGSENRLFRVEIHKGGDAKSATFKWSEDNGAIVYPVREIKGKQVYLESLGRDEHTAIRTNDWVEVVDDKITLTRQVNPLLQVMHVDRHRMTVTLNAEPANNAGSDKNLNPILRRWAENASTFVENTPVELGETGVNVQFSEAAAPSVFTAPTTILPYRTGDYWLIPARIALGNVIWPGGDNPEPLPPHGIDEHYAPLALTAGFTDKRWRYEPIANPV